jgi:excisionase family DNA binding protein
MLGVAEAAAELGVSERRVRQMLADGVLDGERIGRAWVIDAGQLRSAGHLRPKVGRPWSAASAWALLALADGKELELSPVERSRAKKRLAEGLARAVGRLAARAELHRFYAHPSVIDRLAQAPKIVRGGVSAAVEHKVDLLAQDGFDGYIRASDLDSLVSRFALEGDAERPNVVLRVVDDAVWPFREGQRAADRAVVAVDLLESDDARSRRSGAELAGRS